ncbi:MAG TPA: M48 family metallopeptidase [Candidatus Hydrogenedentes bacterium]|nr:M48 family metallopeptidase [Candidatus Hydrogenedentota bacterium]
MRFAHRDMGEAAEVNAPDSRAQTRDAFILLGCLLFLGVMAFYAVLLTVNWLVTLIPPETESRIFAPIALEQFLPMRNEDPSNRETWGTWKETMERLRAHPAVLPLSYRLVLVESDQPNAFAIPGGTIAVTSALVDAIGDDRVAIAMVLGHELGHFAHRDHLRGLGRSITLGLLISVLFGNDFGMLGNAAINLVELRYSRRQEEAADLFSARLLLDTLGTVDNIDGFFRRMAEQEQLPRWAYMFSTHPHPEERIRALETFARQYRSKQSGAGEPEHSVPVVTE